MGTIRSAIFIQSIVQYFQTLHSLRGVHKGFTKVQASGVTIVFFTVLFRQTTTQMKKRNARFHN